MSLFSLKNLRYKNILSIPSLEIPEGKTSVMFGKTGLGKTTILKLLNNLISPSEGSIEYKNRDITNINPSHYRREIMMLPQQTIVFEKTIREDILVGVKLHKLPKPSEIELKDLLVSLQIDKKLDASTKNLSGGEKQRVSLAPDPYPYSCLLDTGDAGPFF